MKSLIIGSQGLIGSALTRAIPTALQGIQMEAQNRKQVYIDITKYETLFKVFSNFRPDVVYLAAAIANVDKCEDWGTSVVNVKGSTNVLRLCESFESKLVFYSSPYVFDGKKRSPYATQDEPNPLQSYGKQKLVMENLLAQSDANWLVLRTVGVFGIERKKKNFAKQVISSVFAGKEVYAPKDQYMNPVLSDDLAKVSVEMVNKNARGIYHAAGDTCCSKFEFARRIAQYFGYENKVIPLSTTEMNQRAIRPEMGCLDSSELGEFGISVPSLDSGLQRFLASEYNG